MNSENFTEFLSDVGHVDRLSYAELKSLVMEYPASIQLWKLLLAKAYFDNKSEYYKVLESAAIRTRNRKQLKTFTEKLERISKEMIESKALEVPFDLEDFKKQAERRNTLVPEETQEEIQKEKAIETPVEDRYQILKNLFEEETEKQTDSATQEVTLKKESPNDISTPASKKEAWQLSEENMQRNASIAFSVEHYFEKKRKEDSKKEIEPPKEILVMPPKKVNWQISEENIARNASIAFSVEHYFEKKRKEDSKKEIVQTKASSPIAPMPKKAFSSWNKIKANDKDAEESAYRSALKKARKEASYSVKKNKAIISETIAQILVRQEHFDEAIQMYRQLCLKFPEKSAFFDAQINKIKELR